jgi:hypothetical protein
LCELREQTTHNREHEYVHTARREKKVRRWGDGLPNSAEELLIYVDFGYEKFIVSDFCRGRQFCGWVSGLFLLGWAVCLCRGLDFCGFQWFVVGFCLNVNKTGLNFLVFWVRIWDLYFIWACIEFEWLKAMFNGIIFGALKKNWGLIG